MHEKYENEVFITADIPKGNENIPTLSETILSPQKQNDSVQALEAVIALLSEGNEMIHTRNGRMISLQRECHTVRIVSNEKITPLLMEDDNIPALYETITLLQKEDASVPALKEKIASLQEENKSIPALNERMVSL